MWNANFLDVKPMDPVMSVDDKIALKSMKDSVKLVDGKYQVPASLCSLQTIKSKQVSSRL